jgi:predicted PurR-regulated permease PerM
VESNLTSKLVSADVDPAVADETQTVQSGVTTFAKTSLVQFVIVVLGAVAFLYSARPVVLPIFLAGVAAMTLKPLIRWLSWCHLPPALAATVVMGFLLAAIGIGFFQLGCRLETMTNKAALAIQGGFSAPTRPATSSF